jgi:hypothetical protein
VESVTRRKEIVLRAAPEAIVLIAELLTAELAIEDLAIAARRPEAGPGLPVAADHRTDRAAEVLPVEIATGRERTERTIPPGRWMD